MSAPTADPLFAQRAIIAAARCVGVDVPTLLGPSRKRHLVRARWAVMVAMRKRGSSVTRIATRLGRSDHVTVCHALKVYQRHALDDPEFAYTLAKVEAA